MVRISEAIKDDHRKLESCYNIIVNSEDEDERTRFQNQFTWELARHSVAEELVLFPAMEKLRSDGKEKLDDDRREHSALKEQLYVFQDLNSSDPRFIPTITMMMEGLARHMQDEETNDLVILEESLTSDESEKLAESLGRTKMFVPSRSHSYDLGNPHYETVADLLTAPLDHLRDLFRKWPEEEEGILTSPML
ncbi:unnamed protein product [Penicillium nalgiovense]|uniref:Hemerythrin-like domain-containing protein n=1 Tax=Penicillium nalgiovense TaxID=60175 RepID=A0A1V6Z6J5_PENNA|nr:hypothetical protein PENNAL_c0002G07025 [Penicillium nalgiovense]CAG7946533.1 unnamed protein product [Penicillium nalgiovense]CAG7960739.1 unnamed protein product [Penicillium nalgiovense]CAG7971484.1 unnamed protein product [Penicillium nalgiovense]CAG7986157.1 unnamed protein product [Penicillium nalgiovense]